MGLIDKYANTYFLVARRLIEFANAHGGITEKQIRNIADEYGVIEDNVDFISAITDRDDAENKFNGIRLFEHDESVNKYKSIIKNLPVVLSNAERKSLTESLAYAYSGAFVGLEASEKLGVTQRTEGVTTDNLRQCVATIRQDKWIAFDNITADGIEYKNQHIKPQKIEVAVTTDEYYVSGYSKESGRLIKCNLDRMVIHGTISGNEIDIIPFLEEKRSGEPIRLRIENSKGATDRAFNMFSSYEKDGFYDKKTGYYILDIHYYQFEERALIEKILSLGAAAIVVSPSNIVEKIKGRICQQLLKLT